MGVKYLNKKYELGILDLSGCAYKSRFISYSLKSPIDKTFKARFIVMYEIQGNWQRGRGGLYQKDGKVKGKYV